MALAQDGTICGWGDNYYGQRNTPVGTDFTAIAAGRYHNLALRSNGSIAAWGDNSKGQCSPPVHEGLIAIGCGLWHSLAIEADGTVVAWGWNEYGQCNAPTKGKYVAVCGGHSHSLALSEEGQIVAWGSNSDGQCDTPDGTGFTAIAAGSFHSVALASDGSVAAWGSNEYRQCKVPRGKHFVAIAAGALHTLALRSNGTTVAWGHNDYGQCNIPPGTYTRAVMAGGYVSLVRKASPKDIETDGRPKLVPTLPMNVPLGSIAGFEVSSVSESTELPLGDESLQVSKGTTEPEMSLPKEPITPGSATATAEDNEHARVSQETIDLESREDTSRAPGLDLEADAHDQATNSKVHTDHLPPAELAVAPESAETLDKTTPPRDGNSTDPVSGLAASQPADDESTIDTTPEQATIATGLQEADVSTDTSATQAPLRKPDKATTSLDDTSGRSAPDLLGPQLSSQDTATVVTESDGRATDEIKGYQENLAGARISTSVPNRDRSNPFTPARTLTHVHEDEEVTESKLATVASYLKEEASTTAATRNRALTSKPNRDAEASSAPPSLPRVAYAQVVPSESKDVVNEKAPTENHDTENPAIAPLVVDMVTDAVMPFLPYLVLGLAGLGTVFLLVRRSIKKWSRKKSRREKEQEDFLWQVIFDTDETGLSSKAMD